jgi:hypothetical protein
MRIGYARDVDANLRGDISAGSRGCWLKRFSMSGAPAIRLLNQCDNDTHFTVP